MEKKTSDDDLKVLCIANHKGGVGKTTVSKLVTEYFVRNGYRVLGIDIDPQCNFSTRFVKMDDDMGCPPIHPDFDPNDPDFEDMAYRPPGYWSIAEFFRLGVMEPYDTPYPNLKFIPSHKVALTRFLEEVDRAKIDSAVIEHIKEMLSMDYARENFDLVVIDTPPQTSSLTSSAIRAATHLLIPTTMTEDSLNGMIDLCEFLRNENLMRIGDNDVILAGILPTLYHPKSAAERQGLEGLLENRIIGRYVIDPPMRYMFTYANSCTSFADPRSLFDKHEDNPALNEASEICEAIMARIFPKTKK